jgi:putative DNA primase/helicase
VKSTLEQKDLQNELNSMEQADWVEQLTENKDKMLLEFYFDKFKELGIGKVSNKSEYPIYPLNDIGIAQLFYDIHKSILVFVLEANGYYAHDGKRFRPNNSLASEMCKKYTTALFRFASVINDSTTQSTDNSYEDFVKFAASWLKHNKRKSLLADAATISPESIEIFDKKPLLINFQNGTYDLETMEFREHRTSDRLTMVCRADYKEGVKHGRWTTCVDEAMDNNPEKSRYLQKFMGYSSSGEVSMKCFLVSFGPQANNGKTTIYSAIEYALGDDYAKTVQPQTFGKRSANGGVTSSDLARLKGVRFVNVPEPPQGFVLDAALVKQVTSGGDSITARFVGKNPVQFQPSFKINMLVNHMPHIMDPTLRKSGRMKVLLFNRSFTDNPDLDLHNIFREPDAMSAIYNWLIEGYRLFIEDDRSLETPEALETELENFHKEAFGQLDSFLDNNIVLQNKAMTRISDIHRRHCAWANESNLQKLSKHAFLSELRSRYKEKVFRDSKLGNTLKGYSLVEEPSYDVKQASPK